MKKSSCFSSFRTLLFCCLIFAVVPQVNTAYGKSLEVSEKTNPKTKIYVAKGKYFDFYHIIFTLRPESFELSIPTSLRIPKYGRKKNTFKFEEGGMFEIFVHKEAFPISAPECDRYIILRMPSSISETKEFIRTKKKLFEKIGKIKKSGTGKVDVVIELNPYIKVKSVAPLDIELTGCNIFFRYYRDAYLNYVGNLKKEDIEKLRQDWEKQ